MVLAAFRGDFSYDFFLLLHILCAIVGFGSTFVYPLLAANARQLPPEQGYAISHTALVTSKIVSRPFIYLTGAFGILLIILSDGIIEFSETWITLAFLLFIVGIGVSEFLHTPNLKAMDALQEKLATGAAGAPAGGGPPPEVAELQERGKKAGMFGGILHLVFFLLLIDMVFKPGA